MINVCLVIGSLDRGGAELQVLALAQRLDRRRVRPRIVCLSHAGADHPRAAAAGVSVDVLTPPPNVKQPLVFWIRRLAALIRAAKVDIVHGFIFPTYSVTAVAARLARARAISGVRSLGLGPERQFPLTWFEKFGNRLTDCAVANSEAVRQALISRDPRIAPRCRVIHNGVDVAPGGADPSTSAARPALGLDAADLVIAVIANFHAYKGHTDILEVHAQLVKSHPHAVLLLAGSGREEGDLRALADRVGISARVRFLGQTDGVLDLLEASDILLHASRQEGFPNAILQAMAAGRPVVATRVGGVSEQVVSGTTGLLVEAGDRPAMLAALRELADAPGRRAAMGAAGRERAASLFSWDRAIAAHEALYEEIAQVKKAKASGR